MASADGDVKKPFLEKPQFFLSGSDTGVYALYALPCPPTGLLCIGTTELTSPNAFTGTVHGYVVVRALRRPAAFWSVLSFLKSIGSPALGYCKCGWIRASLSPVVKDCIPWQIVVPKLKGTHSTFTTFGFWILQLDQFSPNFCPSISQWACIAGLGSKVTVATGHFTPNPEMQNCQFASFHVNLGHVFSAVTYWRNFLNNWRGRASC